jgi:VanZ family protein
MKSSHVLAIFVVYAVSLFLEAWWPFNFQFSLGVGEPPVSRVELLPFGSLAQHRLDLETYARKLAAFIPVGAILAGAWVSQLKGRTILWRTLLVGAGLSGLIQLGRYFLPGHLARSDDVIVNAIGALIGASPVCFGYLSRRTLGKLTAACAACFLLAATWPWHFSLQAASIASLSRRFEWSPFRETLSLGLLRERALNGLMTLPLGLLCAAYMLRGGSGRQALKAAALLGLCCSASVEGLQCFLPHRVPSLPDICLNTLGAVAGGAVALYLERRQLPEPGVNAPVVPPVPAA